LPGYRSKKTTPIKYTSRDFESIKRDLVDHVKRYYPDNYKDFSENSFGSLMLDTVSYVGDILSFYLDYSVNESFLSTAVEYDNIVRLGRQMGYKYRANPASTGVMTFFLLVPASSDGVEPDIRYLPILRRGSKFNNNSGAVFTLAEDIDFANPANTFSVATQRADDGNPTEYVVKTFGVVTSGEIETRTETVGDFQRFLRIDIDDDKITDIIEVIDAEGHKYHEVDHLSQNMVFTGVANKGIDKYKTPLIMKPIPVPRRFTVEQNRTTTSLQFGYGSEDNLTNERISDPSNVVLQVHGKDYVTDKSFDPTMLIETDKLGVVPSNTTLTIKYRRNTESSTNASTATVTNILSSDFQFASISSLDLTTVQTVRNSLECTNESPIVGNITAPSSQELKYRAYGSFSSQNRAVTLQDYQSLIYNMPPMFGAVKRANVVRDADSNKRNLNIYVISEDDSGFLSSSSPSLKNNIKTWLSNYKMINDTVDILDGRIVNIGIQFSAVSDINYSKYEVLERAKSELILEFANIKYDLGEPFRISDILKVLKNTEGLLDVTKVRVFRRIGTNYSSFYYNLDENLSANGRLILIPENAVFELKFPNTDIVGTIL
jgi:hypothetical protein